MRGQCVANHTTCCYTGWTKNVIPLLHYITLYERYHFFGPSCICSSHGPRIIELRQGIQMLQAKTSVKDLNWAPKTSVGTTLVGPPCSSISSSSIIVRPRLRITTMRGCACTHRSPAYDGAAPGMRWWYPRWCTLQKESSIHVLIQQKTQI